MEETTYALIAMIFLQIVTLVSACLQNVQRSKCCGAEVEMRERDPEQYPSRESSVDRH